MDASTIERQRLARQRFFGDGAAPTDLAPQGVDPAVLRGWQRCRAYGFEPDRAVVFRSVQASRVRANRETSHLLRTVASAELNQLGRSLAASGVAVILTDAQLMVLDVVGRSDRMSREMRSLAREGVDLSERSIGSNALSLAAVERVPSIVLGNGHFFSANALFACAAAPLMSPTGVLQGIVDVTTCRDRLPVEAPFLVSAAAKAIENAMFWHDTSNLLIRFHPREDLVDTALGAIIACTVDGEIVGANQMALSMLGLSWPLEGVRFERCFRQRVSDLMAQARLIDHYVVGLTTQPGASMFARVRMPADALSGSRPRFSNASREATPASSDTESARLLPAMKRDVLPASLAGLPVLLVGESGTGKTWTARWLADAVARAGARAPAGSPAHCWWRIGEDPVVDASPPWATFERTLWHGGVLIIEELDRIGPVTGRALVNWLDRQAAAADPSRGATGRLVSTATNLAGLRRIAGLLPRIGGAVVELPPLRERADKARLVEEGLREAADGGQVARLTPAAWERLLAHSWPGNLHQLRWVCRHLQVIAGARSPARDIDTGDLPASIVALTSVGDDDQPCEQVDAPPTQSGATRLRELEMRAIEQALAKHQGNLSSAARELGVSRGTLYRRMRSSG